MSINSSFSTYEKLRINLLRGMFLLLLPILVIVHAPLSETFPGELMENLGLVLIVGGVLGRAWSILYIGGHKNRKVITDGPYSLCRHPLYLFSTIAVLGFGMMLQSVLLVVVLTGVFGGALYYNALREEERLRRMFGPDYDRYARTTPAIIPAIGNFHTKEEVTFSVSQLRQNFWDATVFVALIPLAEILEWGHSLPGVPGLAIP
jgi:protein-S-isoprenylcysteine O-methyltransferase Ste14